MTEADIAWAGGLFEGEGCIAAEGGKSRVACSVRLQLAMCDRDVVERFAAIMGGRATGPHPRPNGRQPVYLWLCTGIRPCQAILRRLWPYLGERRQAKAAELFADYYMSPVKRRGGRPGNAAWL